MEKVKVSLILTIFNEEKTILRLLDSILSQTTLPQEVVITDGGSSDNTVKLCKAQVARFKEKGITLVIKVKKGNRSVGRNEAIRLAQNDIILITDAGCELDRNWVKEISRPFREENEGRIGTMETKEIKRVDVVAGYYEGKAASIFQKCLIPYVLVMPDRVNLDTFLPATRSMGIRKTVFEKAGGFDTKYSHNEDYVLANRLKSMDVKIAFRKSAIVYWYPRNTLAEAYHMFWRFAYGDAEAGIWRIKVGLIFARYILAIVLLVYCLFVNPSVLYATCYMLLASLYLAWAVQKNYRYVQQWKALSWLPVLQFVSDLAVLSGTIQGTIKSWNTQKTS